MKTKTNSTKQLVKIFIFCVTIFVISNVQSSFAQISLSINWQNNPGKIDSIIPMPTSIQSNGNTITASAKQSSTTGQDIIITKYDREGITIWQQVFTQSHFGKEMASNMKTDLDGSIYCVGFTQSLNNSYDFLILKYNPSGSLVWNRTFNFDGASIDAATSIDISGNEIYVTGLTFNGLTSKIISLSYSTNGNFLWQNQFSYNNLNNIPISIVKSGNEILVSGACQFSLSNWDIVTLKLDSNGNYINHFSVSGTANGQDQVKGFYRDNLGNLFLAGKVVNINTNDDAKIIKLNSAGSIVWQATYDNNNSINDCFNAVGTDSLGFVYTTGKIETNSNGSNLLLAKYSSNGTFIWRTTIDGVVSGNDEGNAIYCYHNKILVAGKLFNGVNYDMSVFCFDSNGNILWKKKIDFGENEIAQFIETNLDGEIIVSGKKRNTTGVFNDIVLNLSDGKVVMPDDPFGQTLSTGSFFVENNGQLKDTEGNPASDISYFTENAFPQIFFQKDSLYFFPGRVLDDSTLSRFTMYYPNFSEKHKTYAGNTNKDYHNVYKGEEAFVGIGLHKVVKVEHIYDGIDAYYVLNDKGLNIYYVAAPGKDFTRFKFGFTNTSNIAIDSLERLNISLGSFTESFEQPQLWQFDASGTTSNLALASYHLNNNNIRFIINQTLSSDRFTVIALKKLATSCTNIGSGVSSVNEVGPSYTQTQGNLAWSTFYGATSLDDAPFIPGFGHDYGFKNDYGLGSCLDDNGFLYTCGVTKNIDFPINNNTPLPPAQSTFGGDKDGFIISFDNNGVRRWTTFMGGTGADTISALAFNPNNDKIYFCGSSSSNSLTPPTNSNTFYFDNQQNGNCDAIFGSFTKQGGLQTNSFFGGSEFDHAKSIIISGSNVLLLGNTRSTETSNSSTPPSDNKFPVYTTSGLGNYYQDFNAGNQDIFIAKFDDSDNLVWSTFFGSNQYDKVYEAAPRKVFLRSQEESQGNFFYFVGHTEKNSVGTTFNGQVPTNLDFPLKEVSSNAFFQKTKGGFITQFNNLGDIVFSTTMNKIHRFETVCTTPDAVYAVGVANAGGEYSCSDVLLTGNLPVCNENGGTQSSLSGEVFVVKLNHSGTLSWSSFIKSGFGDYLVQNQNEFGINPVIDKKLDVSANSNQDIFIVGPASSGSGYGAQNFVFEAYEGNWNNIYYQPYSAVGSSPGGNLPLVDYHITSFNENNYLNWNTFYGGGDLGNNLTGTFGLLWPEFSDFPSSVECFENKDLFIVGYATKPCVYFPLFDPGQTPTGQAYFWSGADYNRIDFDVSIAKFNMQEAEVGTKEVERSNKNNEISIQPNPSNDIITIKVEQQDSNLSEIKILNSLGQIIFSSLINKNALQNGYKINIESLPKGIYFVSLNNILSNKFIKN
jgi:hypothetical protein